MVASYEPLVTRHFLASNGKDYKSLKVLSLPSLTVTTVVLFYQLFDFEHIHTINFSSFLEKILKTENPSAVVKPIQFLEAAQISFGANKKPRKEIFMDILIEHW